MRVRVTFRIRVVGGRNKFRVRFRVRLKTRIRVGLMASARIRVVRVRNILCFSVEG